jgi:tRNA/rRNA methyltransferase
VVLVRPRQSENIGFVARAVANHGIGALVLVDPPAFDPERARWSAPGARQVVNRARIVASIAEAVEDMDQVFGTTARERRIAQECWSPGELCSQVLGNNRRSAILFGPEDSGLRNEEIAYCRALVRIPTSDATSLNLAQAVTTLAALLRHHSPSEEGPQLSPPSLPNMAVQGLLIDEAMELLECSGYLTGRSTNRVRTTLFQLLGRVQEDGTEAGMLRGMLRGLRYRAGLLNPSD